MTAGAVAEARSLWSPVGHYLNTASYGLPPEPAWRALQTVLEDWRGGRTSWEGWGDAVGAARASFARLAGFAPSEVAVGATVSQLCGLIAAAVPDGGRVLVPAGDFTSLVWPWLVHGDRGVTVSEAPLRRLADAVGPGTDVVAYSLVQSASGEVADAGAIAAAAAAHGALTVVDATQACGWLPLEALEADAVVVAAYKWLMAPRGTAFLAVGRGLLDRVRPLAAGWYAAEDVHGSYYGTPLRLAGDARRLDISPAWFCWAGTAPALELIEHLGVAAIGAHDVALANRFRDGLGLAPSNSAIVAADVGPDAGDRLAAAGVAAAFRDGRLRVAFHVYNTHDDVDAALGALRG